MEIERNHDRQIFEVTIAGVNLKLRSSHDEQTVRELVSFIDRKIQEASPQVRSGNLHMTTVLAMLNVAEELLLLRKKAGAEFDRLESKTDRIIASLEAARIPKLTEV